MKLKGIPVPIEILRTLVGLMISWINKFNVVGFISCERSYYEEHINTSELHVVQAAYFPSTMAAREARQEEGSARADSEGGGEL